MADFPRAWWAGLPAETPNLEDRTGNPCAGAPEPWCSLFGNTQTPAERVAMQHDMFSPLLESISFGQPPGDALQNALGYQDILNYRPDTVKPMVLSLREAQRVPLPRKRPSGGK